MDFIAHLLLSGLIFADSSWIWAIVFGTLPDFIPFGLQMIIGPFRNKQSHKFGDHSAMVTHYQQPQNRWVYRLYNYTHSLIIWGIVFGFLILIGQNRGFFPWFAFAWLLHIVIDIPTHTKAFFAPQFLTPLSTFCIDGHSWADPKIMVATYSVILGLGLFRIFG
jgi:hypothetical protein